MVVCAQNVCPCNLKHAAIMHSSLLHRLNYRIVVCDFYFFSDSVFDVFGKNTQFVLYQTD